MVKAYFVFVALMGFLAIVGYWVNHGGIRE